MSLNALLPPDNLLPTSSKPVSTEQAGITVSQSFKFSTTQLTSIIAHYSAQYAGGAVGPMVIHGPQNAAYDVDIGPVMLSDWYHSDYYTLVNQTMNGGVPASNNNLVSDLK